MKPYRNEHIDGEAVDWLVRLEDVDVDADATVHTGFVDWLRRSPRHVRSYLEAVAAFRRLDGIDGQRSVDVEALIDEASATVVPLYDHTQLERARSVQQARLPHRLSRAWWTGTALVAAIALGWLTVSMRSSAQDAFSTGVGEQREIKLNDGSLIHLNTRSRVRVVYSERAREIQLEGGEALFTVAHDATRPFRVISGATTIQAIGTQFNVYRRENATTVTVMEGVVQIAPDREHAAALSEHGTGIEFEAASSAMSPAAASLTRLTAGEQAKVVSGGHVKKESIADVERALAWRHRELVFEKAPLSYVVAEFNRYNRTQIRLMGDVVASKELSGIFDADYPQSLILFLERDPSLFIATEGDTWVIGER